MKTSIQSVLLLIAMLVSTEGADDVIYVYAQVGGTITFELPEKTDFTKHYVYWYFEGGTEIAWCTPLGNKRTSEDELWKSKLFWTGDRSLTITNIPEGNFGTFVGEVKLFSTTISTIRYRLLKLTATVSPVSPVLPGTSLSLVCNAETFQGQKKPQIHWLNPRGERKSTRQSFSMMAKNQDNGDWTCVATYNQIENKAKVSVTVVDLSPAPLRPQYTSKSRPLTIPCSIPDHISWGQINATGIKEVTWHFIPKADPSPQRLFYLSLGSLTWNTVQNKGLRPLGDPKKRSLSLTKSRGTGEDEGDYICALKFKNGVTLSRTVHVQVLQITSSLGTKLISGQQLNLTCSPGHPLPPDLQLKWLPPEQSPLSSSLTPDRHPAHLTIPEVGTGDSGKWRCELWQNNTRLTLAEITLNIEPKLSVWMQVVICSVIVIVLLLVLLIFILYRRRQRKTRTLRHRLCQCKNPKPKGFYRT
ncbi:CD4-1 molecule [Plectropomus leopardus]|uniref:CD4-1 molecule n=1 Tax=Plectropomus leopardus TaxID=160734 RepID=UPI001C4D57D8|nr:CD4-1 molecule [Plectropomus leopardus]